MIQQLGLGLLACIGFILLGTSTQSDVAKVNGYDRTLLYGVGKKQVNKITWMGQSDAKFYSVQKKLDANAAWIEIESIQVNENTSLELSLSDEGVDETASYRVIVIDENGSSISNEIQLIRKSTEISNRISA